jgi:hypothetical protein
VTEGGGGQEHSLDRLKPFRGVATRCDNSPDNVLGADGLASTRV